MNDAHLIKPSPGQPPRSLTEQPLSTIQAAIRSPSNPGATLTRTNTVLSLYFDPDNTPEARAAIREEFVRALAHIPEWAMHRAFDAWVKRGTRRPTPGEIAILADQELAPLLRAERNKAAAPPADRRPDRVSKEAAAQILERAGFGAKGMGERKPHWTDAIEPGMENDADAIRAARNAAGV